MLCTIYGIGCHLGHIQRLTEHTGVRLCLQWPSQAGHIEKEEGVGGEEGAFCILFLPAYVITILSLWDDGRSG